MKKKLTELETQIALQAENFNKISLSSSQKEEQLNNDITEYINQINDLKNEMEVLNNIITNLTEEKENNAIKITNLLHENEKLKQNMKKNSNTGAGTDVNSSQTTGDSNNKKYEEIIMKLKNNMLTLKEENKALEEVILKQESEVNQLSSKVEDVEKVLQKKERELEDSREYSDKLISSINFHKNEIMKIKQKQSQSDNNKNDKNSETIMNLQKELQTVKKSLEAKESKLSVLVFNNKELKDKLEKLVQFVKNELNCNNGNSSKYNNNNKNKNNIYSSHNNYHTNKIIISKPQSQLKNKTTRMPGAINPISSHILPKNNIKNNIENYKDNNKNLDRSPLHNIQNIDDKKLFIVSKHKIKSKTPGKIINTKNQFPETKPDIGNKHNIEIVNKKNEKNHKIYDNICPNIYDKQKNSKNSKLNINEKYKQIENKYKNDIKEMTKEDTLFNEDDIKNLNLKKEIISHGINIDDFDSVPMLSSQNSQALKSKKEGRNTTGPIYKKSIEKSPNRSQEKEFPIIESYCVMLDKENQNRYGSNYATNESNVSKNITSNNFKEKSNESNIEAKQVQDVKDRINKILNEIKY